MTKNQFKSGIVFARIGEYGMTTRRLKNAPYGHVLKKILKKIEIKRDGETPHEFISRLIKMENGNCIVDPSTINLSDKVYRFITGEDNGK